MKRIILASLLLATPALAQTPPDPAVRAWQLMYQQATAREQIATSAALELQDKVQALTAEVAKLKAPAPAESK